MTMIAHSPAPSIAIPVAPTPTVLPEPASGAQPASRRRIAGLVLAIVVSILWFGAFVASAVAAATSGSAAEGADPVGPTVVVILAVMSACAVLVSLVRGTLGSVLLLAYAGVFALAVCCLPVPVASSLGGGLGVVLAAVPYVAAAGLVRQRPIAIDLG